MDLAAISRMYDEMGLNCSTPAAACDLSRVK